MRRSAGGDAPSSGLGQAVAELVHRLYPCGVSRPSEHHRACAALPRPAASRRAFGRRDPLTTARVPTECPDHAGSNRRPNWTLARSCSPTGRCPIRWPPTDSSTCPRIRNSWKRWNTWRTGRSSCWTCCRSGLCENRGLIRPETNPRPAARGLREPAVPGRASTGVATRRPSRIHPRPPVRGTDAEGPALGACGWHPARHGGHDGAPP